jgi:TPR repeat protein
MFGPIKGTILMLFLTLVSSGSLASENAKLFYDRGMSWFFSENMYEATFWWELAAKEGHSDAQNNVGSSYRHGEGVLQDYAEALKWYKLAAMQGTATSHNSIGEMYLKGQGLPRDNVRAHMWFNIATTRQKDKQHKKIASDNRDQVAARMTSSDITKAQVMAQDCLGSNYRNCGWQ